jgi:hypothetical protein
MMLLAGSAQLAQTERGKRNAGEENQQSLDNALDHPCHIRPREDSVVRSAAAGHAASHSTAVLYCNPTGSAGNDALSDGKAALDREGAADSRRDGAQEQIAERCE